MHKRFNNDQYANININHQFNAAVTNNVAKITIYGDIGESWWDDSSTSASDIETALKTIDATEIHVHINSLGGDVFDGIAIYNNLKNHDAKIIVHVDGIAASAASLITMAGDEVIMNTGAMLMIHEASTWAWGTKTEIQKTLNALEGIDKSIADIYMIRFKGEKTDVEALINAETWFTAEEAVELGFADSISEVVPEEDTTILDPEEIKNSILAKFRNSAKPQEPTEPPQNNLMDKFKRNSNE